jgi:hypothetical protein
MVITSPTVVLWSKGHVLSTSHTANNNPHCWCLYEILSREWENIKSLITSVSVKILTSKCHIWRLDFHDLGSFQKSKMTFQKHFCWSFQQSKMLIILRRNYSQSFRPSLGLWEELLSNPLVNSIGKTDLQMRVGRYLQKWKMFQIGMRIWFENLNFWNEIWKKFLFESLKYVWWTCEIARWNQSSGESWLILTRGKDVPNQKEILIPWYQLLNRSLNQVPIYVWWTWEIDQVKSVFR